MPLQPLQSLLPAFYRNEGMLNKQKGYVNVEDVPQSNYTDIVLPDGSRQTCLFHALIQAKTQAPSNVVKQKVTDLRRKVTEEVRKNMPYKFSCKTLVSWLNA